MSRQSKPSIVFVHGIWADGSSSSKLIRALQAEGHEADGRVWMKRDGIATFAGDLPEQEQKVVWATHAAPAADLFTQKVEGTTWKARPSWYIVANKDRTVQPELQRFVAKRMGATTFETDSSHVPMLSQPGFVLDVIRKAAKAVQNA
jgi:pimeloyl-ACP methyl ester carboxylesterase